MPSLIVLFDIMSTVNVQMASVSTSYDIIKTTFLVMSRNSRFCQFLYFAFCTGKTRLQSGLVYPEAVLHPYSDSAASSPVTLVQKNPSDDRSRPGGIYCISGTIQIVFKQFF
jgi:hypothetical protein